MIGGVCTDSWTMSRKATRDHTHEYDRVNLPTKTWIGRGMTCRDGAYMI